MADPEEISFVDEITKLVADEPFAAFTIVMASGQRYDVGSRDTVMAGKSVLMLMPRAGGHHLLRSNQISEVSVQAEARDG